MDLPISTREESSKNGVLHYTQNIQDASIQGVFAFSFYLHSPWGHPSEYTLTENSYLKGIKMYVDAIERPDSVFHAWKIVLYTDKYTADWLTELGHPFVSNSAIILSIVEWPYYQPNTADRFKDQVNGDIMRCMRFRAFFDFPLIPVFVRDADTIWAMQLSDYSKRLSLEAAEVYEWEANYLQGALRFPNTFIFATSLNYKRFWHENKQGKRFAPLGAFAGLQSAIPAVPCFQEDSLWESIVAYILSRSQRKNSAKRENGSNTVVYSNQTESARVGKDEQILIYLILPACIKNAFFFELDMFRSRDFSLKGKRYNNLNYPKTIFERGNNANLRELYTKAIQIEFKENLERNRYRLTEKNSAARSKREKEVLQLFKQINDPLGTYTSSKVSNSLYSTSGNYYYVANELMRSIEASDTLKKLFEELQEAEQMVSKKRLTCIKTIIYSNKNIHSDCLNEVQAAVQKRTEKYRNFLDGFFAENPREAFVASRRVESRYMNPLLDWYDGKPLPPPPPVEAPDPLNGLAFLFPKPGEKILTKPLFGRGRQTRKRKAQRKKQTCRK